MAKSVVGLNIKIGANVATLQRDLGKASGQVRRFGGNVSRSSRDMTSFASAVSGATRMLGPFIGGLALIRGVKFAANLAAEAESAEVAFTTMLGSVDEAKKVLAELAEFSATTPFQLDSLRDSARLLIANNLPAEQLIGTMKVLGDLAAGTGTPLIEITRIFNKMRATGRVTLENINELMLRNIPIWDILSEKTGRSKDEIRAMATAGEISFDLMNETLMSLTRTGGLFGDAMAKQSATLTGVLSTLKDNVSLLVLEIGTKALPVLKSMAEGALVLTGAIRNLDAGTVQSIAQIGAFTLSFTAVVLLVPKVVAGLRSIILTLRSLTVAATLAQSVTGVGLAKALAGLAVGVAAAFAVGKAFDKMTVTAEVASDEVKKTEEAMKGLTETTTSAAGAMDTVDDAASKWKAIGDRIKDSVATPAENLRAKLQEIRGSLNAGAIDFETYGRAIRGAIEEFGELNAAKVAFNATPAIGAAVRGTSGGFSAVQDGQRVMRDLVAFAKKKEEADKRRDKFLSDMLDELESIAESVEDPIKVKEHDII